MLSCIALGCETGFSITFDSICLAFSAVRLRAKIDKFTLLRYCYKVFRQ